MIKEILESKLNIEFKALNNIEKKIQKGIELELKIISKIIKVIRIKEERLEGIQRKIVYINAGRRVYTMTPRPIRGSRTPRS